MWVLEADEEEGWASSGWVASRSRRREPPLGGALVRRSRVAWAQISSASNVSQQTLDGLDKGMEWNGMDLVWFD